MDGAEVQDDGTSASALPHPDARSTWPQDEHEETRIARKFGYSREQFVGRLGPSQDAVHRAAFFLQGNGIAVEVPPQRVRSKLAHIRQFTENEADIVLSGTPFVLEVKWRSKLHFEGLRSFPYPDISVDTVSGYRSKKRMPLAYVMVSANLRTGLVLPTFTEGDWVIRKAKDHERGVSDEFYFANKKHFAGRRRWLIELCKELQSCAVRDRSDVLTRHGFNEASVPRLGAL